MTAPRTDLRDRLAAAMGYQIVTCGGCGFWPCRTTWMRTCSRCGDLRCLVCLPTLAPHCLPCTTNQPSPVLPLSRGGP